MARANSRLPKIPEMTIRRLSIYTRCLLQLEEDGVKTISSQELAERFSLNSAQVRKDLKLPDTWFSMKRQILPPAG